MWMIVTLFAYALQKGGRERKKGRDRDVESTEIMLAHVLFYRTTKEAEKRMWECQKHVIWHPSYNG